MCHSEIIFLDHEGTTTKKDKDLVIAKTNITFTTDHLIQNRHYNVTINATNSYGSNISHTNISKGAVSN